MFPFFFSLLQAGNLPIYYNKFNVCPNPKKGDLSVVSNHRPISLLNAGVKAFGRLIFKYLYTCLSDNNLLPSFQSGFIPGDSTVNQLTFPVYWDFYSFFLYINDIVLIL